MEIADWLCLIRWWARSAPISDSRHPEAFLTESGGSRIFVNEPNAFRVGVIDTASGKEIARWTTLAAGNFSMALDAAGHRLFVVYRVPAIIAVFDTTNGAVTERVATCRDADDIFFDATRHRVYASCGEGTVVVLATDKGLLHERGRLQTRRGARTALFAPEVDRLYVAAPAVAHEPAAILVYRPR
jgi:DNA-binding beta-propeller fold protein YncE